MKIAIVGVGLIGGSIGLAARERLGAEVAGWDPGAGVARRGARASARSTAPRRTRRPRCEGAEAAFVAAPVGALPAAVAQALAAAGDDCVVSDVGSTKRAIVDAVRDERFIGGHPLAGAENAGVRHARAELFDGATWYLTPTAGTRGTLYERLHRLLSGLGAMPAALDAETHDRMLATVSHLPHVLANVLVAQAARALSEERERLPATGPSFRDITRVAGANTAIWRDIYLANADALIAAIDDATARLADVRGALERGDGAAVADWNDGAREDRRKLLEADLAGGVGDRAARLGPEPARRRRRRRARARARRRQHPRHGAVSGARPLLRLHRAVDRRRGAGRAGRGARRRPRAAGGARMNQTFRPGAALRGTLVPPPDKSLSHRAALLGAMSAEPVQVTNFLDAADTRSSLDAARALGALVDDRGPAS